MNEQTLSIIEAILNSPKILTALIIWVAFMVVFIYKTFKKSITAGLTIILIILIVAAIFMYVPMNYAPGVFLLVFMIATFILYEWIIKGYKKALKDMDSIHDDIVNMMVKKMAEDKLNGVVHDTCPRCKKGEVVIIGNENRKAMICSNYPNCKFFEKVDRKGD